MQLLREAYESAEQNVWAVVPEFSGKHGHPYLAGREMIERFLREPNTSTARDVEHRYQDHIQYVPVTDPFVSPEYQYSGRLRRPSCSILSPGILSRIAQCTAGKLLSIVMNTAQTSPLTTRAVSSTLF